MSDSRRKLVESGAELMWRAGYTATTPRQVMEASEVGQGSLYHHFPTKADLGVAAITANAEAIESRARAALVGPEPGVVRLRRYLLDPRDATAGCRIGGLTQDPAVVGTARLLAPVATAFARITDLVDVAVRDAQEVGDVRGDVAASDLAALVISVVQGGFVLSRARQDAAALTQATRAAYALLDAREPAADDGP